MRASFWFLNPYKRNKKSWMLPSSFIGTCNSIFYSYAEDGTPMACPEQKCPPMEADHECMDDSDCAGHREGTVCCRDLHGCYGRCELAAEHSKPYEQPSTYITVS